MCLGNRFYRQSHQLVKSIHVNIQHDIILQCVMIMLSIQISLINTMRRIYHTSAIFLRLSSFIICPWAAIATFRFASTNWTSQKGWRTQENALVWYFLHDWKLWTMAPLSPHVDIFYGVRISVTGSPHPTTRSLGKARQALVVSFQHKQRDYEGTDSSEKIKGQSCLNRWM